ncbi:uncharacterized protein K452DRAFT_319004 [Aplosporella prunicola CBS 121167]|uniref:DUF7514 domain-containing protein n=1 Tax=Aplosporella prunicola CBS 121167 TaxID=1176127 RepID=A0A6A6BDQ3_9PEZI|nr:uncharacterized protein K452DRAFT_319004 [Aplosporella prunicola CBS 121167]KAF2141374.1 hypothetical protein K452DRAFT_319004 [Aplosporella prunicola CBS 121167]
MAYNEGYRSPDQAPYSYDTHPDSQLHPSSASSHHQRPAVPYYQERSRASSDARSDSPQAGQPVYDAVNNAFDQSDAASHLDPSLVAQITEQVRRQVIDTLKSSGQLPPKSYTTSSQAYAQPSPGSSVEASLPPRDIYTPPSPSRHESIRSTGGSNSPNNAGQDTYYYKAGREREGSNPRYAGKRTGSPTVVDYSSTSQYTTQSPPPQTRPSVERKLTEVEETAIEKTWQALFDANGQPTPRLGQFLRGLALHLISDYEPKRSLVVTPVKMRKFYEEVLCEDETIPWDTIFGTLSNESISKMYRDLCCQHHFVQDDVNKIPDIPSLTPDGFQTWMTLMIQADPDLEFKRLSKAVKSMPISNADDLKERFPKELSRRLFPKAGNTQAHQHCVTALSADGKIQIRSNAFSPPPSNQTGHSYSAEPCAVISDDSENEPATSIPIERERKPYSAREGGGKIYEDLSANKGSIGGGSADIASGARQPRSQSNASATVNPYRPSGSTTGSEYPPNTAQTRQHHRMASNVNPSSRRRSPSFGSGNDRYGSRSEPNVLDIPSSYYASNIYNDPVEDDPNGARARFAKDAEARRNEWARKQAEEDAGGSARSYTSSSQGRHGTIYDDEYYRGRAEYDSHGYGGYPPPPPRY